MLKPVNTMASATMPRPGIRALSARLPTRWPRQTPPIASSGVVTGMTQSRCVCQVERVWKARAEKPRAKMRPRTSPWFSFTQPITEKEGLAGEGARGVGEGGGKKARRKEGPKAGPLFLFPPAKQEKGGPGGRAGGGGEEPRGIPA